MKGAKHTNAQRPLGALRVRAFLSKAHPIFYIYFSQIYINITKFIIKYHLQFQSNHYKHIKFRRFKSFLFLDNFYSNLFATVIAFMVFLLFYVINIEVGRARVYFWLETGQKWGLEGLEL